MKNDFFKLKDHGTTVRREVLAGITTFMTMAYVLAVQPSAICGFGPDPYITDINGVVISKSALLVMCALVSGIITLFMGLYATSFSAGWSTAARCPLVGPWRFYCAPVSCLSW